ncbi:MAG TPA: hypothetical protein VLG37_01470 [Candidatus Saccharimonadales bacterium]|nr:hypothetical protein [Candidatus Saccharimonadales bacterium]
MDPKGALKAVEALHEAMEPGEQADFEAALAERFNLAGAAAGSVAVAETTERPQTELEKQLAEFDFLNPDVSIDLETQLDVMTSFWKELGVVLRADLLIPHQRTHLEQVLETHPGHRVVPTLLSQGNLADARSQLAEAAKGAFGKNQFHDSLSPLWTPDQSYLYGKLLADPDQPVKDGRKSYGLGYKMPDGSVVGRDAYLPLLMNTGQIVEGNDGTLWTFPVMDVQVRAPRTYESAGNLHALVSPTNTPEGLLAMQLLHQANGTPNPAWAVDFANEAVYELDKNGKPKTLVSVAGVGWGPDGRQVCLGDWRAGGRSGRFGVRAEESGL